MRVDKFQIDVATGRFTLPVVILVCLFLWIVSIREWSDLISLGIVAAICYLMIEANTSFTLIRTRTTLPVCMYAFLASSLFFLHSFGVGNWAPLAFLLAVTQLFYSFESSTASIPIFHSFFFLSLGSFAFPQMAYFCPLFLLGMIPFRSMGAKTFVAALLGLLTPYWFLFGYAFWFNQMSLFYAPLVEMIHFHPIEYGHLMLNEILSWGIIALLLMIGSVHYWQTAYMDKTRTRIYHSFLTFVGLFALLFSVLQPMFLHEWMQMQLICASFLMGHLFTLTRNRFSGILFIVTFVVLILLSLYNLWMQFFSF